MRGTIRGNRRASSRDCTIGIADLKRHKCRAEREKLVQEQKGVVQCKRCNEWFRSRSGLAVHKCDVTDVMTDQLFLAPSKLWEGHMTRNGSGKTRPSSVCGMCVCVCVCMCVSIKVVLSADVITQLKVTKMS